MQKLNKLAHTYFDIKGVLIESGYAEEIDWQCNLRFENICETDLLKQAAWVILSSGFSTNTVAKIFPAFSTAFYEWESSTQISVHKKECREKSLQVFRNRKKVDAIIFIAEYLSKRGFSFAKEKIINDPLGFLSQFPFIGPITSYHLAKNLGVDIAKPDRHLVKISKAVGYSDPKLMCEELAKFIGEKVSVVDIVLWRYATENRDYLHAFKLR